MGIRIPKENPDCSHCGQNFWLRVEKEDTDKQSTIFECQNKKCGNVLDFMDSEFYDTQHEFYHEKPDKEPTVRDINSETCKTKQWEEKKND